MWNRQVRSRARRRAAPGTLGARRGRVRAGRRSSLPCPPTLTAPVANLHARARRTRARSAGAGAAPRGRVCPAPPCTPEGARRRHRPTVWRGAARSSGGRSSRRSWSAAACAARCRARWRCWARGSWSSGTRRRSPRWPAPCNPVRRPGGGRGAGRASAPLVRAVRWAAAGPCLRFPGRARGGLSKRGARGRALRWSAVARELTRARARAAAGRRQLRVQRPRLAHGRRHVLRRAERRPPGARPAQ